MTLDRLDLAAERRANLSDPVCSVFAQIGKRFGFGGERLALSLQPLGDLGDSLLEELRFDPHRRGGGGEALRLAPAGAKREQVDDAEE